MPNRPWPDGDDESNDDTESYPVGSTEPDPATEVITTRDPDNEREHAKPAPEARERRFTAPGFDAKETTVIQTSPEPATKAFHTRDRPPERPRTSPKTAMPQLIPPRLGSKLRRPKRRDLGWVLAVILLVLAVAAIAILGTVLLTRNKHPKASQEDRVRTTIQTFDVAVQTGDLAALRSLTCGATRDGYVNYDEHAWAEAYRMVSAAKRYPVVATIDQVVVNGEHAEANVTTFIAYDPQVRSTRSFDLQFLDDRWKICQSPSG